jgi:hypothetical protein
MSARRGPKRCRMCRRPGDARALIGVGVGRSTRAYVHVGGCFEQWLATRLAPLRAFARAFGAGTEEP